MREALKTGEGTHTQGEGLKKKGWEGGGRGVREEKERVERWG